MLYFSRMLRFERLFMVSLFALGAACKNDPGPAHPLAPSAASTADDASTVSAPAAASSPSEAKDAAPSDVCRSDADCVISTFPGCCPTCACRAPKAMTRSYEAAEREICGRVECVPARGTSPACPACIDPAREGMTARCIDSACTLVETSRKSAPASAPAPSAIDCRTDDDCWIDTDDKVVRRPAKLRGRKVRPCKDSEHTPACEKGVCGVKVWKC